MKQNRLIKIGAIISGALIFLGIILYAVIGYVNFESISIFAGKIPGLSLLKNEQRKQPGNIESSVSSQTENINLENLTEDSDRDGLSDKEEEKYKTDKNNPDTDKDGYLDGEEVRNGYNPNGKGKL